MKTPQKLTFPIIICLFALFVAGCIPGQMYKTDKIATNGFKAEIETLTAKTKLG